MTKYSLLLDTLSTLIWIKENKDISDKLFNNLNFKKMKKLILSMVFVFAFVAVTPTSAKEYL